MNNSGETTTFKYSGYTSPFKTGSVNNSATLIGYAGTNAGRAGVLAGGSSSSYSNTANSIVWGEQCWIGDDQQYPSAVFGRFCRSTGSGNLVAGNNSAAAGVYSVVVGEGNSCDTIWGSVFGRSCSIDGASYMSIVAGNISSIQNSYAAAVFGEQNGINGSQYSSILGGKQNSITSSSPYNAIVGSNNSSITGGTNVVMIGCSGRTADASQTTYTENHASFGQSYQGYFDNGSGSTFTINWNNGNTQKMSFTGAGGITCNNTQTGANYRMVINNPNGYTPTSFTAAGRTIKFNGGSFVVYSGESICELFITNDSVFVNQLGLFS